MTFYIQWQVDVDLVVFLDHFFIYLHRLLTSDYHLLQNYIMNTQKISFLCFHVECSLDSQLLKLSERYYLWYILFFLSRYPLKYYITIIVTIKKDKVFWFEQNINIISPVCEIKIEFPALNASGQTKGMLVMEIAWKPVIQATAIPPVFRHTLKCYSSSSVFVLLVDIPPLPPPVRVENYLLFNRSLVYRNGFAK